MGPKVPVQALLGRDEVWWPQVHTVSRHSKLEAFEAFTNKVVPGRWKEVRPPNAREFKSATILELPINEAAAKVRVGPPTDDDSPDAELPTWAGVVPLVSAFGDPQSSPGLASGIPLAASVRALITPDGGRGEV